MEAAFPEPILNMFGTAVGCCWKDGPGELKLLAEGADILPGVLAALKLKDLGGSVVPKVKTPADEDGLLFEEPKVNTPLVELPPLPPLLFG